MPVQIPDKVIAIQDNWRFCTRCSALFWAGGGEGGPYGVCPNPLPEAPRMHVPHSWNFYLLADPTNNLDPSEQIIPPPPFTGEGHL